MIFSRTRQYAIHALIYQAAQPSGWRVLKREIAHNLDMPSACLGKIFHDLCRDKLLHSSRGRSGVGAVAALKVFPPAFLFGLSPSRQRFRRLSCLQQAVPSLLSANNINKNNKLLT
ncbi:MAG: Rrf2 family transcriptional regulator [Acidithiobacillus ferriphilus]